MVSLVLIVLIVLSCLAGIIVYSQQYYWFSVDAYFVYDVRVHDAPSQGFIYDGSFKIRVNPSSFKLEWRITGIKGDWVVVELSIVFPRAVNMNTSEILDYRITKVFEVNIKTLQAYTDFEGRRFWALEWPFLLRPEQVANNSVKLLFKPLEGPVVIVTPDYEWYKRGIEPVFREINETIVSLTNGSRNISSYVTIEVKTYGEYKAAYILLNKIPPGWSRYTEGSFIGLTLNFIAIDMPPAPRDYNYKGISLDRSRLASGSTLELNELNDRVIKNKNIYLRIPEIAGIYNITIKQPGDVRGEYTYGHVLVVDRWGNLYVVDPITFGVREALYDVVSGILVYAKIESDIHRFLRGFYLFIHDDIVLDIPPTGFRRGVIELYLADTSIQLERPIIGGKMPTPSPPVGGGATTEEPSITPTAPITPQWERAIQGVTPRGVSINWFPVVTAILLFSLLALLVIYLRFRGR